MKKYLLSTIFIFFLTPGIVFAAVDSDNDRLSDDEEAIYYTDPNNADTDGDRFGDGLEVENDYSPLVGEGKKMHENDYDKDGLNDWLERWFKSDIGKPDSDYDGRSDFEEVMAGYDPTQVVPVIKYERRIEVDRTAQRLYYFVDKVKALNLPVSTGNLGTPTPAGEFTVLVKRPFVDYIGVNYSYPHIPWNMQFKPRYYLHATTWHNDFGKRTRSHGCVNMRPEDAELLYKYIDIGMAVTVTGTTPLKYYVGT